MSCRGAEMLVATGDPGKSRPGTLRVAIPRSRRQGTGEVEEAEAGAKLKAISVAVDRLVVVGRETRFDRRPAITQEERRTVRLS